MERFSTIAALDMQNEIVSPVFDRIYTAIFDSIKPVREPLLSGIQLVENFYPKKKKSKWKNIDDKVPTNPGTNESE